MVDRRPARGLKRAAQLVFWFWTAVAAVVWVALISFLWG